MISSITMILIASLIIINREFFVNYFDKMNRKNKRAINREIVKVRLTILAAFVIVMGLYGLITG